MKAAARICTYLEERNEATRPEMARVLNIHEKSIETAMRKLVLMGFVADTGRKSFESGARPANVYIIGDRPFDQKEFSRWNRQDKSEKPKRTVPNFDALQSAMNQLVWTRTA